jgi:hypothetical protein
MDTTVMGADDRRAGFEWYARNRWGPSGRSIVRFVGRSFGSSVDRSVRRSIVRFVGRSFGSSVDRSVRRSIARRSPGRLGDSPLASVVDRRRLNTVRPTGRPAIEFDADLAALRGVEGPAPSAIEQ